MTYKHPNLSLRLFVIVALFLSVLLGVMFLSQSQDIRNKAKTPVYVTICHKADEKGTKWVELSVPETNLKEYFDSGDILGSCSQIQLKASVTPAKK